jgi:predicted TPR repeat methyltransferase
MLSPRTPSPLSADELQHAQSEAYAAHSEGRLPEARERYLRLLALLPHSGPLHYNLGLVLYDLGDFDQALRTFTLAAHHTPEDRDTLFNLALCRKKTGDLSGAVAAYQHILAATPEHLDSLYNLGGCYRDLRDEEQARCCYHRILEIAPDYHPAANNLAYLYHRAGNTAQAIHYYSRVLELRPEDESVHYLLAGLLGIPLDHAPDTYVRDFFDSYAETFEHSLVEELGYDNPQQLFACLCGCEPAETQYEHGLDLGCGTGLSGLSFKERVAALDGVDLSANMLVLAASKGCYAHLFTDSIDHHLHATAESYDLFLATDVFIYVGDLLELFTAARARSRSNARFCFSTERLEADGYQLLPTGRFAYSRRYIRHTAAATGWTVLAQEATRLRRQGETWISGDLWILGLDRTTA